MRSVFRLMLVGMACLLVHQARAEQQSISTTANAVLPGCKAFLAGVDSEVSLTVTKAYEAGRCDGGVSAIAILALDGVLPSICLPSGVTHDQAVRVVVQYLEATPRQLHADFALLALDALALNFPCRAQVSAPVR